jgi:hypothetical protein
VLVDLDAQSARKWLRLFLRPSPPVQLGWFNSFATSGLDCFDGIVGDDTVILPVELARHPRSPRYLARRHAHSHRGLRGLRGLRYRGDPNDTPCE